MDPDAGGIRPGTAELQVPVTIRIGVTGQRTLADELQIRDAIRQVLSRLDQILHDTPHRYIAISSLSEGSDRVLADEVLLWPSGGTADAAELHLLLPVDVGTYLDECSTHASRESCRLLLDRSASVDVVAGEERERESVCEEIGHLIVQYCDVLVAIWDGKPAISRGGTAEMVKYARIVGRTLFWIDLTTGKVIEERHGDGILEACTYLNSYNAEKTDSHALGREMDATFASYVKKAQMFGLDPDVLRPLTGTLLPHFTRASLLCRKYELLYMRAGSLVYALAAAAVATVTVQTLFFSSVHELLWLEVAEMGAVLVLLIASRIGDWHRKWIDYRFLSERLRTALFLSVFCVRAEMPDSAAKPFLAHSPNDWIGSAFDQILEMRPLQYCSLDLPFEPLKQFLVSAWIDDQIAGCTTMSSWNRQRFEMLSQAADTLFTLTLVLAAIHAIGLEHGWAPAGIDGKTLLAAITIILPAVAGALGAIRIKREYLRNSERYAHMVRQLSIIGLQIKRMPDMRSLVEVLRTADEVTLREQEDWRVVFRFRELETP
ncbi:MAG: hypothetical protein GKC04_04355 [Methanomicrobiales archaeon]|nr:hypothetical protein [Methanomicrobiales archaeon]